MTELTKEIADYVKKINKEFIPSKDTDPDLASCQPSVMGLILEAKERGPLDLRITIDKDGVREVWRVRVEKFNETT